MHAVKRFATIIGLLTAVLVLGPNAGLAHAADASPAGDVLSLGDPAAPGQIDLYLDPLCPYSGKMVQSQGEEIGRRIESGKLHVNLRFVDFLDKYSASGTYDSRAIYASFVVADQSRSSDITWRFIREFYAKDQQPEEEGDTDLSNDQLAGLAARVDAPQSAQDLIRVGLPVPFDARAIASNNLPLLRAFPKSGVPMVVIDNQPVDGESAWLDRIPR
ncbi:MULTISPECIES: thioredoxin domain-containing protein [Mycobacteroides]|jgi:protein-disulfide isomerase|uniref:Serine/threonine protein kinase n=1 Tax=Mycobacteroides chelonae TaxID=1774 RepID=A0A1S1KBF5_MYCCH|nr:MULTISPECIES: thioredoxin domain-containing protein [Mycobacteroides]KRQ29133.1 serine/threonine protein kinase [Mycobacteroides sp. H072]KRQ38404.1 serine/threonine protein kinase [Mycobacteroides sp. H002]KRQ52113.1 serine/threonine protein kinase [Mycobacteroides sp. H054]KRQ71382.1 serine/threonine protein kinase [Mycobacteroides sp. H001]MBF9318194.1 thioredoxin domain-containing protein [Mycobacteroides chelonae]